MQGVEDSLEWGDRLWLLNLDTSSRKRPVVHVITPSKEQEDNMMDLLMAFLVLDRKYRQRGEEIKVPEIDLIVPDSKASSGRAARKKK